MIYQLYLFEVFFLQLLKGFIAFFGIKTQQKYKTRRSNKENPLPECLQEKLKKGVKIERLGITVKPTVSGLEDIDVEEGLGNKKMIIILISLIIAGIIGGIYLMNK